MIQDEATLPQEVIKLYHRCRLRGNEEPTANDLANLLVELSRRTVTFLVVDGLDEYEPSVRDDLIARLQPAAFKNTRLNILFLSRVWSGFWQQADGFQCMRVEASLDDIDMYITHCFETKATLRKMAKEDPSLRDDVRSSVHAVYDGM